MGHFYVKLPIDMLELKQTKLITKGNHTSVYISYKLGKQCDKVVIQITNIRRRRNFLAKN
jgi:hypothetical protein